MNLQDLFLSHDALLHQVTNLLTDFTLVKSNLTELKTHVRHLIEQTEESSRNQGKRPMDNLSNSFTIGQNINTPLHCSPDSTLPNQHNLGPTQHIFYPELRDLGVNNALRLEYPHLSPIHIMNNIGILQMMLLGKLKSMPLNQMVTQNPKPFLTGVMPSKNTLICTRYLIIGLFVSPK